MNGQQLEQLANYVTEYDSARQREQAALRDKEKARDSIMALFSEVHEHRADVAGFTVEVVTTLRESIPVELAKVLLTAEQQAQLIQQKAGLQLNVRAVKKQNSGQNERTLSDEGLH